jgi:Predicted membrane protein (DUF2232)
MVNVFSVGIGAGLVSALLIAVIVKATALAMLLFLLAPIPILIVTLGWDQRSGLIACAVGGLALALALSPLEGLGFAVATALPAWWLGYLALLGRSDGANATEWYPLGRLLAWIAATAALTVLATAVVSAGDYETFQARWRQLGEALLRRQTETPAGRPLPELGQTPASAFVEQFATVAPMLAAVGFTLILTLYLWVGAKIVSISGRLPRPWPYIPATMMPRSALAMLVGGVVLANLSGFASLFGFAVLGAILMAFGLQGLAALHQVTAGRANRVALLSIAYMFLLLSQGTLFLALVLFGIADTAFGIRPRLNLPYAPPGSLPGPPPGPWSGRKP